MSNPAVIVLENASSKNGKFKRFVIEDNLAEAIHLHIDQIRMDFTINEFLEFAKAMRVSLDKLDLLKGYSIENFDEYFLKMCAPFLHNLKEIKIEEMALDQLRFVVRRNFFSIQLTSTKSVDKTPAFKYLEGYKKEFINYSQHNYPNSTNEVRLASLMESIKKNGYPSKNNYIILFNGQNIVRDGQHRAAILAHLYGIDSKIKVMRFNFHSNDHFIKSKKNNLVSIIIYPLRKLYRKIKQKVL